MLGPADAASLASIVVTTSGGTLSPARRSLVSAHGVRVAFGSDPSACCLAVTAAVDRFAATDLGADPPGRVTVGGDPVERAKIRFDQAGKKRSGTGVNPSRPGRREGSSSPETRYRAAGSRNPPPRVIFPFTGVAAGSRNPPPKVILLEAGRRNPPPRRMRPPSVVEVFMEDSNLDELSRMIQLRNG